MIEFSAFEELSRLKDYEPLLEKIKEIMAFVEEKGGKVILEDYPITLKNNLFSFNLTIYLSYPLPSDISVKQFPQQAHRNYSSGFVRQFLDSIRGL